MIRISLFLILSFLCLNCYSQTLKVENGVLINKLKGKDIDLFPEKMVSYSGLIGIDYLQKKWYYLSSEIGYLKLGGKGQIDYQFPENHDTESWSFIQLNTTFRVRVQDKKMEFYLGAGPLLNVLIGSGEVNNEVLTGYVTKKINWGCKTEGGFNIKMDRFLLGLNCSYLIPFSPVSQSPYTSLNARSLGVYLGIGYRLN